MCSGLGLAVGLCCVVGDGDKRVVPASFPWDVAGLPGLCGGAAPETCWAFVLKAVLGISSYTFHSHLRTGRETVGPQDTA